ncbi:MAG TPA: hypothetical protein VFO76_07365 [Candidatus Kapabacteria bacterium]|nr:hypothetical protein [Candidatus Kapabacteria bacterium]
MRIFLILLSLVITASLSAQHKAQPKVKKSETAYFDSLQTKIALLKKEGKWQFPVKKMWDEALAASQRSHKPTIAFNVDYVDSASIGFRDRTLTNLAVQVFLCENFEIGVNDFSTDPPPTVGFDSLRKLGLRFDGLEKGYAIAMRPTAILIRPDSAEIERIPLPNLLTAKEFIAVVTDYLHGKNTVQALRQAFWRDTTSFDARKRYLNRLTERSDYDSVVYQLGVIATLNNHPDDARDAAKQYAYLRMNVEGKAELVKAWLYRLPKHGDDSLEALQGLRDLLEFYQQRKKADSIARIYDQIFAYTGVRDPDLVNNYAWDLVTYSKNWERALVLSNEALAAKPQNQDYLDTRAQVYYALKRYDEAIADEEKAMKLAHKQEDKDFFQERLDYYKKELLKSQTDPATTK